MSTGKEQTPQMDDALRFAIWLERSTWAGFAVLVFSFVAYVAGWITPFVPTDQLTSLWGLSLHDYLAKSNAPTGWAWLKLAMHGDYLNLVGIVLLISSTLPALMSLIAPYAKRNDRIYLGITIAVIAVVLLAASGIL